MTTQRQDSEKLLLEASVMQNIVGQFEGMSGLDFVIKYSEQVKNNVVMAKTPPLPNIETFNPETKVDENLNNLSLGKGDTVIFDCDGVIAGETLDQSLFFSFDEASLNGESADKRTEITAAMNEGMVHGKSLDYTISKRLEIGGQYYNQEVLDKYINEKLRGSMNPYMVATIQALIEANVRVVFRTGGIHYIMDPYLKDIGVSPDQIIANNVQFDAQGKVSLDINSQMLSPTSKADWFATQEFPGKVVEIGDSLRDVQNGDIKIGYGEYSHKKSVYDYAENYLFEPEALYYYMNKALSA